jgi:hypothetical protein
MRAAILLAVAFLFSLGVMPANARGGERVWSGLVMATNHPPIRGAMQPGLARGLPPPMHRLHPTLRRTFGYDQFDVIGQSHKVLRTGQEDWLAVSKHFSLHVDSRGATRDGYRVHLQLFQDRQLLLETDANLSQSSPLVIKGPQVGSGQLLLLLVAQ